MAVGNTRVPVDLRRAIQDLVDYAIDSKILDEHDRIWAYNTTLEATGASTPGPDRAWTLAEASNKSKADMNFDLEDILAKLERIAISNRCITDTQDSRDRFAMHVLGALMPRPSAMVSTFEQLFNTEGSRAATKWFYHICCSAGYVRQAAVARNVKWKTATRWGDLEITINLSKPEKDPREIAAAGKARTSDRTYPTCQLCIENEGYSGRSATNANGPHPARQNLRIIPIKLGGERWGLQYSPYAYFNEHCIAMSAQHRPMHIDHATIACLLDFVDSFPDYFVGSNADLPIVGGSILSHDHFQGGAHEFPMMKAKSTLNFSIPGFSSIKGEVLDWPLSTLRLSSTDRREILEACDQVIKTWRTWSDETVGITARTSDGTPHNTITPIVRRIDDQGQQGGNIYEVYLALRCNITNQEHPLGVFHPHEQWHHIKRENIGLIEVMGLAILPPRLMSELAAVRVHILEAISEHKSEQELLDTLLADPLSAPHATWAAHIFSQRSFEFSEQNTMELLHEEVGIVFSHVLEDAGVFKWDKAGRAAQQRFIEAL